MATTNDLIIPVGYKDLLEAMEMRARTQKIITTQFHVSIVMLTMNVPGPTKSNQIIYETFQEGFNELIKMCGRLSPISFFKKNLRTGPEGYILVPKIISCLTLKREAIVLEYKHPMGRWFDIDVVAENGLKISREELGESLRRCFLCNKPAKICRREGNHSIEDLYAYTIQRMQSHLRELE